MTGKRYSKQRELIYQCLMATHEHPTAEMLYQWLKPENPSLSLGTVYRNLNLLADEGLVTRMPFPIPTSAVGSAAPSMIWRAWNTTRPWMKRSACSADTR